MTLPPFPRRYSDIHAWWECARRASTGELAAFIANDGFEDLDYKHQAKLVRIYEQAKVNTWNMWAVGAAATGVACFLFIGIGTTIPEKVTRKCTVDPVICAQQGKR